jgi:hypothetical protein
MLSFVSLVAAFSWVIDAKGVSIAIQIGVLRSNRGNRRRDNDDAKSRPWRLSFRWHGRRLQSPYYADVDAYLGQLLRRHMSHYPTIQEDKQKTTYYSRGSENYYLLVIYRPNG